MTNAEGMTNDQMLKPIALEFVIRISSLFRHSTVVLRRFPDKLLILSLFGIPRLRSE